MVHFSVVLLLLLLSWESRAFQIGSRFGVRRYTSSLQMADGDDKYDLAVIGAGPVGVQVALLAAAAPYNKKVCLVDAPRASGMLMNEATNEDLSIGGPTGLFSKALRDTSKRIKVSTLRGMGLREDSVWNEIINSCVDLASSNAQDVNRQLEFAGVELIQGFASFPDSGGTESLIVAYPDNTVSTVSAKNVLIATGSKPFLPGGIPFDGTRVFDSDSINQVLKRTVLHVIVPWKFSFPSCIAFCSVFKAGLSAKVNCHHG